MQVRNPLNSKTVCEKMSAYNLMIAKLTLHDSNTRGKYTKLAIYAAELKPHRLQSRKK